MAPGAGWWWRRWRMWWLLLGVGVCVWTPSVQPRREDIPRENLGFPTATEGEADTTHTTWGLSLINADKYGAYTWPELFLADLVYRWRESTPFWPPEKKMEWPQDRSTPPNISDPKMKEFPAFDPWVWRTTTEVPSRKYGQVLLAQGYYMLVQLNGDYESCTQLIFEEKIYEFFQVKDCLPSYNKKWFWTYPWLPDMIHNLRVKDRSSKKVLFIESYYSLPEEPPKIEIDVKNGMGFVEITFVPPYEKGPSLNGYVVFYRNTLEGRVRDRWLDVLSMYVVYNERFPYVRPTHPCEEFRDDRTFCILVLDHVGPIEYSRAADRIYFQLSTFRIVPGPWRPYFVIHWNRYPWAHVCYFTREWHCPEMMGSGGKAYDYPHREKYRPMTTPKSTTKSEKHVVIGGSDNLHTFPNSTNGPALLRGLKNEDLCVIFAGLTLLLLLIGGPLAYFLGQHSGKTAAEDRWARLASQPGVVSVPLGHGGAFWRGRSSLPGNPAPPQ